jgi:hypothetical protein
MQCALRGTIDVSYQSRRSIVPTEKERIELLEARMTTHEVAFKEHVAEFSKAKSMIEDVSVDVKDMKVDVRDMMGNVTWIREAPMKTLKAGGRLLAKVATVCIAALATAYTIYYLAPHR